MDLSEQILSLVRDAIQAIDTNTLPLSSVIRKCNRIARLRNDFFNLYWLEWELVNVSNKIDLANIDAEISPHFTKEEFDNSRKAIFLLWGKERPALELDSNQQPQKTNNVHPISVGEFEIEVDKWRDINKGAITPQGMHPFDTAYYDDQYLKLRSIAQVHISHYQSILERIKNRVYDFLTQTEKQILYGQIHSDSFERNRQYVELQLGQLCPEALSKFISAYRRSSENDPESWTHALTSCRRLIKDLADKLYPPRSDKVIGADGKPRILTDELYISRLWQYIYEQMGRSISGELLLINVQDLGNRIDRLYDLTNKGVHAEVTDFEVNQCLIQTYVLIGDILRILDKQSAASVEIQTD